MVLGGQLRRLRESRGISRPQAGYTIRASESKISRLELGRVTFKERDVADLLTLYGVDDEHERESFLDLVRQSNQPGWWHTYSDTLARWFQDFIGLEESASRVQTLETQFVPGLLQTEQYARAVVRLCLPDITPEQVERRVALRRDRQRVLAMPRAPRVWALIDEGVLYRSVADESVMRDQWQHLLDLTRLPTVSVQIVPFSSGGGGAEGPFTLLRFAEPELPDVAYLEHLSGALYLDKRSEVDLYAKVFHRLVTTAATPDESRQLLAALVRKD
ncbi:MAG: helix-turn-helix domain-containing protein [Streptosporangiales bacterium]|nr:helix-turn-helix domain-containing protein [Streptosporangiales bacterium]